VLKKLILFFSILDLYYIWHLKEIFLTLNTGFKNLGVSEISMNLIIFILIILGVEVTRLFLSLKFIRQHR